MRTPLVALCLLFALTSPVHAQQDPPIIIATETPVNASPQVRPGLDPSDAPGPPLPLYVTQTGTVIETRWKAQVEVVSGEAVAGDTLYLRLSDCSELAGQFRWRVENLGGRDPIAYGRTEGCEYAVEFRAAGDHKLTVGATWHTEGGRRSTEVKSDIYMISVQDSPLKRALKRAFVMGAVGAGIGYAIYKARESEEASVPRSVALGTAAGVSIGYLSVTFAW